MKSSSSILNIRKSQQYQWIDNLRVEVFNQKISSSVVESPIHVGIIVIFSLIYRLYKCIVEKEAIYSRICKNRENIK